MGRYDIGVIENQDGTYDITADWWGVETTKGVSEEEFKNQLSQKYQYHNVKQACEEKGYAVEEEVNEEDGSIRLVVRKWVCRMSGSKTSRLSSTPKGEVTFQVKGVKGGSCLDETKFLEAGARRRRRGRRPAEDQRILRTNRGLRVDLVRGRQRRVSS